MQGHELVRIGKRALHVIIADGFRLPGCGRAVLPALLLARTGPETHIALAHRGHTGELLGIFGGLIIPASKILEHTGIANEGLPAFLALQPHQLGQVLGDHPELDAKPGHGPECCFNQGELL